MFLVLDAVLKMVFMDQASVQLLSLSFLYYYTYLMKAATPPKKNMSS
jgi:hypothetical protein